MNPMYQQQLALQQMQAMNPMDWMNGANPYAMMGGWGNPEMFAAMQGGVPGMSTPQAPSGAPGTSPPSVPNMQAQQAQQMASQMAAMGAMGMGGMGGMGMPGMDGGISDLVRAREKARYDRNFRLADMIRDQLKELGVSLYDKEKRWESKDGMSGVIPPFSDVIGSR